MKLHTPLLLALCCGPAAAQSGGPWTIASSTIDGGGTASAGGSWSVTGTIGQPDASPLQAAGTGWTFAGGFWPGIVNIPGGPLLSISRSGTNTVAVGWTDAAVGYKLQYSNDLVTWHDYPRLTIQGASSISWPLQNATNCFFRLKKL